MISELMRALYTASEAGGGSFRKWIGAPGRSKNLFKLAVGVRETVLYIKESNVLPGWWGLSPDHLNRVIDSGQPWLLILLSGSGRVVYLASPRDVTTRVGTVWRKAPRDGDYKVHENAELVGIPRLSYEELSSFLMHFLTEPDNYSDDVRPSDPAQSDRYSAMRTERLDAAHVAEFLVRLPGKNRKVAHASLTNIRFFDLLAGFVSIILAPGDNPKELASKIIPHVARMIQVLSDEEALAIRAMCNLSVGGPTMSVLSILGEANTIISERDAAPLSENQLRIVLDSLRKKKFVESVGVGFRWRLKELVV